MLGFIFTWVFVFFILTRFDFYAYIVPFHSVIGNVLAVLIGLYYLMVITRWVVNYFKEKKEARGHIPSFTRHYWIERFILFIQISPLLMYLATGWLWNFIK